MSNEKWKMALRLQSIQHPRKWNGLANMFNAAHPRGAALDAHAKACVRHAAVTAQVEIPFKRFLWQTVRGNLLLEKLDRGCALAAANHFAITFRRQHINTQRQFVAFSIALHVKSFDGRG